MKIGEKLKELRINNNFSQKDIAEKIGTTRAAISNYESDYRQPSYDLLIKLALFFDVSVDYILGLENEDGTKNNPAINQIV